MHKNQTYQNVIEISILTQATEIISAQNCKINRKEHKMSHANLPI